MPRFRLLPVFAILAVFAVVCMAPPAPAQEPGVLERARTFKDEGEYEKASILLADAIEKEPGNFDLLLEMGKVAHLKAREILAEWDREALPNVQRLSRQVQRQFLLAALGALVVAAVPFALGYLLWVLPTFLVAWFALVVALGRL